MVLFAGLMTYLISLSMAASGTATMYTSPGGSQTVAQGNNFTVGVRIATGNNVPVTGAEVYMSYPSNKLKVVSVSYSGTPYNIQLEEQNSGGVLKMVRAAFPMISGGDKLFTQVTFNAVESGTANITFNSNSKVISGEDDSNILANINGVSYNITSKSAPAPTPTPAPSPSPSPAPSDGGSLSPSSPAPSAGSPAAGSNPAPSSNNARQPGSGAQPAAILTNQAEISQARYKVEVLVVDQDKKPVKGVEVSLNKQIVLSGDDGIARFTNVPVGKHKLKIINDGNEIEKSIQILPLADIAKSQFFTSELNVSKFNLLYALLPPIVIGLIAALYFARPRLSYLMSHLHTGTKYKAAMPNIPGAAGTAQSNKPALPPNYSGVAPGSTFVPEKPETPSPIDKTNNKPL